MSGEEKRGCLDVSEEAYGMDCRPGPSTYPDANWEAIEPDYIKAAKEKRRRELDAAVEEPGS